MKLPTKEQLLVTVVVPVYQGERYVAQAIESLSGQTYRELEIIVVDDASTDGTRGLLAECAARDPRVKVVLLEQNVGVHRARMAGGQCARGEMIGFLDADDRMSPEALETMVNKLQETNSDIVISGVRFFSEKDEIDRYRVRFTRSEIVDSDILRRFAKLDFGSGLLYNKIYRRKVLLPHLLHDFGERVPTNEDYLINFGAFADAKRVCTLTEVSVYYRRHHDSVTASQSNASGFCQLLRTYVICRETYSHRGAYVRDCIDLLYAKQMGFEYNRFKDPSTALRGMEASISESLARFTSTDVGKVYEMISLFFEAKRARSGWRRSLYERSLKKLRGFRR